MSDRICPGCKVTKPIEEFSWHRVNVDRHSRCSCCRKKEANAWYQKKKAAGRHYNPLGKIHRRNATARIQKTIREAKSKPCTDCGVQYPTWVMQFDHVPERGRKLFGLSNARCIEKVPEEIAKCDVVCANCHAERTHQRHQQRKFVRNVKNTIDSVFPNV